jgi:PAS domain S-box-containing protein
MRPDETDPLQVLAALERIRAKEGGEAVADDLCATIVSWGRWNRAAFVAHGPGGFTFGAAGLLPGERSAFRDASYSARRAQVDDHARAALAEHRLDPGLDVALVPEGRRGAGLPPFALPGPSGRGAPGARWESGDELIVLPQRADGVALGALHLAEPTDGLRPRGPDAIRHLRLVQSLAKAVGEMVLARHRSIDVARDEARSILALGEELNAIADTQALLDRVAELSARLAGCRVGVLSVYLEEGALLGACNLSPEERALFLQVGRTTPLERRLAKREQIRAFAFPGTGIAYVPHTSKLVRSSAFAPSGATVPTGTWHPEDRLFILIRGSSGTEIGVLSLDEPLDGNAPTPQTLGPLRLAERFLALGSKLVENRMLQQRIARSEEEYRSLVNGAPVGICRWGEDGRLVAVNPRCAEIFGFERPADLLDDPDRLRPIYERLRRVPEDVPEVRGVEVDARHREGRAIRVRMTMRRDRERAVLEGILEDVTEARRLEEHLQRTQRMEALGTLASGIAHDFNNLLAGIVGYSSLLSDRLAGWPDLEPMSRSIQDSALRAADLTRQLLGIARHAPAESARVEVAGVLADCARICRETFDRRIVTRLEVAGGATACVCDTGDLHRAVLNLCINARDAMPEGGILHLSATVDARGPLNPPVDSKGPWIRIDVVDTGVGMDRDVQARLFEPFFTTKPRGKGTGLGLYSVYQTVRAYGGAIEVDSRTGEGTRFRVFLPAAPEPAAVASPAGAAAPEAESRRGPTCARVLVVEDEIPVRMLAVRILEGEGFHVESACDGEEAVAALESAPDAYDLVLLDLILPRQSGAWVFKRLRMRRLDLPVILSSGNVSEAMTDPGLRDGVAAVLPKPYLPAELVRVVRRVLAQQPTA